MNITSCYQHGTTPLQTNGHSSQLKQAKQAVWNAIMLRWSTLQHNWFGSRFAFSPALLSLYLHVHGDFGNWLGDALNMLKLWLTETKLYHTLTQRDTQTVPCSMLLLFAGSFGSCLPLRPDEGVPEGGEGLPWGCALTDRNTKNKTTGEKNENIYYYQSMYRNWSEGQSRITQGDKVMASIKGLRATDHWSVEVQEGLKEAALSVSTYAQNPVFVHIPEKSTAFTVKLCYWSQIC